MSNLCLPCWVPMGTFNNTIANGTLDYVPSSDPTSQVLIGLGVSAVLLLMVVCLIVGCRNQICHSV